MKISKVLVALLLVMVLSVSMLEARWMQYGKVTFMGTPVENSLVVLEVQLLNGMWIPPPNTVSETRTDSDGNWFIALNPAHYPPGSLLNVRATATFDMCDISTTWVATTVVPYGVFNEMNIEFMTPGQAYKCPQWCPICPNFISR